MSDRISRFHQISPDLCLALQRYLPGLCLSFQRIPRRHGFTVLGRVRHLASEVDIALLAIPFWFSVRAV